MPTDRGLYAIPIQTVKKPSTTPKPPTPRVLEFFEQSVSSKKPLKNIDAFIPASQTQLFIKQMKSTLKESAFWSSSTTQSMVACIEEAMQNTSRGRYLNYQLLDKGLMGLCPAHEGQENCNQQQIKTKFAGLVETIRKNLLTDILFKHAVVKCLLYANDLTMGKLSPAFSQAVGQFSEFIDICDPRNPPSSQFDLTIFSVATIYAKPSELDKQIKSYQKYLLLAQKVADIISNGRQEPLLEGEQQVEAFSQDLYRYKKNKMKKRKKSGIFLRKWLTNNNIEPHQDNIIIFLSTLYADIFFKGEKPSNKYRNWVINTLSPSGRPEEKHLLLDKHSEKIFIRILNAIKDKLPALYLLETDTIDPDIALSIVDTFFSFMPNEINTSIDLSSDEETLSDGGSSSGDSSGSDTYRSLSSMERTESEDMLFVSNPLTENIPLNVQLSKYLNKMTILSIRNMLDIEQIQRSIHQLSEMYVKAMLIFNNPDFSDRINLAEAPLFQAILFRDDFFYNYLKDTPLKKIDAGAKKLSNRIIKHTLQYVMLQNNEPFDKRSLKSSFSCMDTENTKMTPEMIEQHVEANAAPNSTVFDF